MSLVLFGCDKIEDPLGQPQTNPQLPIVDVTNVPVTVNTATAVSVDLNSDNNADIKVPLCTIDTPADFPEGFQAEVLWFEIGDDASFTKSTKVDAVTDADGNVTVGADILEAAMQEVFGKDPATVTAYVRIPAWAVKGSQAIRLGSEKTYWADFSTQITPLDLFGGHVIEDDYYLVGSFCDWDFSKAIKFSHSDYNPYDDPVFTVKVEGVAGGFDWVVIPASTYAAGNWVDGPESSYGVEVATEASGNLVTNNSAAYGTPGNVSNSFTTSIKIDMEKLTYESAAVVMFTPGDANGWDASMSQTLSTADLATYKGAAHLKGNFKFMSADNVYYGAGAGAGTLDTPGENITVDNEGLYWLSCNVTDLNYSATYIPQLYVVGDACAAGWGDFSDKSVSLTPSADYLTWSCVIELTDGPFKFRMDNFWAVSFGGSFDNITFDGANLQSPGAGTYQITLDFSAAPYTCTLTAQ